MSGRDPESSLWEGPHEQALVEAVGLMGQVYRKILEPLDLTTVQCTLLFRIAEDGGLSQAELARFTLRDRANVTRVVDGLLDRKLIVRERDEIDRRKYHLYATALGKREVAKVRKRVAQAAGQLRAGLSAKDVKSTIAFLDRLLENYRDFLEA